MKCLKHPDKDAVAQCADCGAGVCGECAERTKLLTQDYGVLCPACYKSRLFQIETECNQSLAKKKRFVIIACILYVIGIAIAVIGLFLSSVLDKVLFCLVGAVFCGLYTAIEVWRANSGSNVEVRRGSDGNVMQAKVYEQTGCLGQIFLFLLGALFGVILTPVSVVRAVNGIRRDKLLKQGVAVALRDLGDA